MIVLLQLGNGLITVTRPLRYWFEGLTYGKGESAWLLPWKDRYQGKPMLVIGNGPSLNQTPLHEFTHVPAIGMNKIDLLYPRTVWRPACVMCVNDVVVLQNWEQWLAMKIPSLLSWKTRWQVPSKYRKEFDYFLTLSSFDFQTDLRKGFGAGNTVTYSALQLAYYCGANPVIMFGVDHHFVQPDKTGGYEKQVGPDVNHFDPNYFASGTYWGLANMGGNEQNYRNARAAFEVDNRQVLDATIGGKLQVFPKISLDEARRILGAHASTAAG